MPSTICQTCNWSISITWHTVHRDKNKDNQQILTENQGILIISFNRESVKKTFVLYLETIWSIMSSNLSGINQLRGLAWLFTPSSFLCQNSNSKHILFGSYQSDDTGKKKVNTYSRRCTAHARLFLYLHFLQCLHPCCVRPLARCCAWASSCFHMALYGGGEKGKNRE